MSKKYYYKDQKVKGHSRTSPKSKKVIKIDPYDRKQKFRKYSNISNRKAQDLFDNKSQRSKVMDLKTTSNKVFQKPNEKWAENTGRSDVSGIDTKTEESDSVAKLGTIELKKYKDSEEWLNLTPEDKIYVNDKIYKDGVINNLENNIPQMKHSLGLINKQIKDALHKQLKPKVIEKLEDLKRVWEKDIEKAETQLEKRLETVRSEQTKKFLKLKTHYGMGVAGEITKADKWKPKEDMTLTEDEYAISKLGGSSDKRSYKEYLNDSKIPIEEYEKYYDKKMKMSDKISQPKLKKLKEKILEIEKKGNRNSRFDIILQYPNENQKELVEKYQKALKRYTTVHSKDFDFKLQKRFKKIKGLPDLQSDQKYYIVFSREGGSTDHISYKKDKEDAVNELEINEIFYKHKRPDLKGKVEIFSAKNIEDVRKQIYSRGRDNFLITGDTYQNKTKIRNIARVKFDYGHKGYIGELSPKELRELKKISGIEIEKIKPLTKEDIEYSKTAKAHSKAKKYVRHQKVKGSIWQKENPFTDEQNALEDSLTWIFRMGDDSKNRLNRDFQSYVKNKENKIKQRLRLKNIEDAPEDVLDAIDRYKKEVYNKISSDLRGKQVAPSMAITGSSNYKGNFDKRESIERNAYERYKKVDKAVDKVVGQYANLRKTKTADERRQEIREKITPKLIEAKKKGKKVYSSLHGNWYEIKKVNQKSITVHSDIMGNFTIPKHFIGSIEK